MSNYDHLHWEVCSCDWCGSSESELVFEGPDRLECLPGKFTMVRCIQCGLYRQNPRLVWSSLASYYPDDYLAYSYNNSEEQSWKSVIKQYGNFKRRKAIERFQSSGRLLEVGCGTGGFLREAKKTGKWEVMGIEPSQRAAEQARSQTEAPILQGRFSDIELAPEAFDAIVLWTVLEHLDQPIRDLRYAYALLKKNGWLFFSIPNLESWDARFFRQYWSGWDLPRHLYLFPRPTLYKILESIGFRIVSERCLSTSYMALGHSLNFWSQAWEKKNPGLRNLLLGVYHFWPTRVALLLPLAILDRLNLTTTITIFAQKNESA